MNDVLLNVPSLHPKEFDAHFFDQWKPTVFDMYDKFHIMRIEDYRPHMKIPILPHRRAVYFFVFITRGYMLRSKNLTQYELEKDSFYCLPAYQISSMEWMSDDLKGFYCHFQPDIFNQNQLNVDIERDFPFFDIVSEPLAKIVSPDKINGLLELLHAEYHRNEMKRENIIALYLTTLLNEVYFSFKEKRHVKASATQHVTKEYKYLLSERISDIKYVSDAAEILGLSPNHLNKCIKEITGKSAHDLLAEMRILHAKVLLKQTDLQIQEISFRLGEFESSDFIRFFRKKTGFTPNEYRNIDV